MTTKTMVRTVLFAAMITGAVVVAPTPAQACGGLFCSSPNLPVNQAAEKIIFAANPDGTVTAVIQIAYQGPAPKFSWLLPISSVPKADQIGLGSSLAFQRLQNATNPRYSLTVRIEGTCDSSRGPVPGTSGAGGAVDASAAPTNDTSAGPVSVEASGTVGAFDYAVISVDASAADRSQAAVTWLTSNGYNVAEGSPGLIRPYLEDGMHLLALKLSKGADTGSIRPLMLTYDGKSPMIPIKLTAVAANDDMGVMTWLLGSARGVPQNYTSLELNEARINWFNANSNYNAVVSAAANEGTGQGFVTEYAQPTSTLANVVWSVNDEAQWQTARTASYASLLSLYQSLFGQWGRWDGFLDAARSTITLPAGVQFADFQSCPDCYQIQFSPSALFTAIETSVIQPVKDVQALLDRQTYVTRLYTTMSASEMTVDPLFTFNPDLADVSNVHTAERVIECNPNVNQFTAPWHINLPQGGMVRGVGSQLNSWPAALSEQPSNRRIVRMAASGPGVVLEDNSAKIQLSLLAYNGAQGDAGVSDASVSDASVSGNDAGTSADAGIPDPMAVADAAPAVDAGEALDAGPRVPDADAGSVSGDATISGGCSTGPRPNRAPVWGIAALLGLVGALRARRSARPD